MSDLSILPGKVQWGGNEAPDEAGPNSHKAVPFSFQALGLFTNNPVFQTLDSEKTSSWTLEKMYPPLYIDNVTF